VPNSITLSGVWLEGRNATVKQPGVQRATPSCESNDLIAYAPIV